MTEAAAPTLTPAEVIKLKKIIARDFDLLFPRRKKATKKVPTKPDPTRPATDETTPTK